MRSEKISITRLWARMARGAADLDPMVPMLLAAALVGLVSAFAVEGFRQAMALLIHVYSADVHPEAAAAALPRPMRVAVPAAAAFIAGLVMWARHRWIKRPRGPEYMEAVRIGDGRLPFAPNIVRTTSSLVAVSGGITIGREGTMIQFAALMSSLIGRVARANLAHQRLVVACGVAAGFAAAYHAPIAGTLFVAEIILGGLQLREISAVLVAAVVGELTTQSLFAAGPLYLVHGAIPAVTFSDLLDAILLGVIAGVLGPLFLWLLDSSRRVYQSLGLWLPVRMGLVGVTIGLLSLLSPTVWGNGYSLVQSMLLHPQALEMLGGVFVLRLVAVMAASAAGIPGGVLTPTLALGGMLGLFASQWLLIPDASHSTALWTLVGMGSLLASTTHAPALAAIMMFETTHSYNVVLATMPACVVASVIGSVLRHRSVYSDALGLSEDESPAPQPGRSAPGRRNLDTPRGDLA